MYLNRYDLDFEAYLAHNACDLQNVLDKLFHCIINHTFFTPYLTANRDLNHYSKSIIT